MDKCISTNLDVSGIGVRVATYALNLLCFSPVVLAFWRKTLTVQELKGIQSQSIGIFVIAFAILLTTVSLATGMNPTLSNSHASIILSLSWMYNTHTWIWFILHVYEGSTAKYKPVGATWSAWWTVLQSPVRAYLQGLDPAGSLEFPSSDSAESNGIPHLNDDEEKQNSSPNVERQTLTQNVGERSSIPILLQWARGSCRIIWWTKPMVYLRRVARLIQAAPLLTLSSIHLSLMSAIGLWLWHDPFRFGKPMNGCTPVLAIFGVPVSLYSVQLRIVSMIIYSSLLIPGLNLLPPFTFFLFLHISYSYLHARICAAQWRERKADTVLPPAIMNSRIMILYVGFSSIFIANLLFIVDTELTLQRNKGYQDNEAGEWGFGQILALLLVLIPLQNVWYSLGNVHKNVQSRFDQAFRSVAKAKTNLDDLSKFLRQGAKPRHPIYGKFGYYLQLAAYHKDQALVELLIQGNHVDIDAVGGDYGTALQAAAARGSNEIVAYLLSKSADPNIIGGDYGTALCAACAHGHLDIVETLLRDRRIKRREGSKFGGPLHVAILAGHDSIVAKLVENGARPFDFIWGETRQASMDMAVLLGNKPIIDILARKGLTIARRKLQELVDRDKVTRHDIEPAAQ
ncbi:hypothetical protein DL96DRAFT_1610297 [Flagelloscypha sp. PMI_526]|nr:hypothetical protein DL96DRAFT_1610297 [Flagelloscypha sp. PMI_526]